MDNLLANQEMQLSQFGTYLLKQRFVQEAKRVVRVHELVLSGHGVTAATTKQPLLIGPSLAQMWILGLADWGK
jgi:hypothetical protein